MMNVTVIGYPERSSFLRRSFPEKLWETSQRRGKFISPLFNSYSLQHERPAGWILLLLPWLCHPLF